LGPLECAHPDFYVVDDGWNAEQMLVRVELTPELLSRELLVRTVEMLARFPDWVVQYALFLDGDDRDLGGVQVLSDRLMVARSFLERCANLSEVAQTCSSLAS
jgi:hypothetical protein